MILSIGSLQLEEYKHKCTDLEAELAVVEMANESNLQQVQPMHTYVCVPHIITHDNNLKIIITAQWDLFITYALGPATLSTV